MNILFKYTFCIISLPNMSFIATFDPTTNEELLLFKPKPSLYAGPPSSSEQVVQGPICDCPNGSPGQPLSIRICGCLQLTVVQLYRPLSQSTASPVGLELPIQLQPEGPAQNPVPAMQESQPSSCKGPDFGQLPFFLSMTHLIA